jgi:hypothetical protein
VTGHRLPHTKRGLCCRCRRRARNPYSAMCRACHADYMRQWRERRRDELNALRTLRDGLIDTNPLTRGAP